MADGRCMKSASLFSCVGSKPCFHVAFAWHVRIHAVSIHSTQCANYERIHRKRTECYMKRYTNEFDVARLSMYLTYCVCVCVLAVRTIGMNSYELHWCDVTSLFPCENELLNFSFTLSSNQLNLNKKKIDSKMCASLKRNRKIAIFISKESTEF